MKYAIVFMLGLVNLIGCSSEETSDFNAGDKEKTSDYSEYRSETQKISYNKRLDLEKDINSNIEEIINFSAYQVLIENYENISKIKDLDLDDLMIKIQNLKERLRSFNFEKNLDALLFKNETLTTDFNQKVEEMNERVSLLEDEANEKIFVLEDVFRNHDFDKWVDRILKRSMLHSNAYKNYANCVEEAISSTSEHSIEIEIGKDELIKDQCFEYKKRLDSLFEHKKRVLEKTRKCRYKSQYEGGNC